LPNNAHFSFEGAEGEGMVIALSEEGIFASTGSACASHSLKPSHVLLALGLSHEQAHASVRFTLGRQTTSQEIDYVLKVLTEMVARLRRISGR
jgi:cysteine desulfurase